MNKDSIVYTLHLINQGWHFIIALGESTRTNMELNIIPVAVLTNEMLYQGFKRTHPAQSF